MSTKPTKGVNLKSLFLGDRAQNGKFYKETLAHMIDEHFAWRQNYMPQDKGAISVRDQQDEGYKEGLVRTTEVLEELSQLMRIKSVPFQSGRYQGHMISETLMPSLLAYSFSMLWNSNDCAFECSPASSVIEEQVGYEMAHMLGFTKGTGWGHITSGGTAANLEAIWYARNVKSLPLAIAEVVPEYVKGKSEWELYNMPVDEALEIWSKVDQETRDKIKSHTARSGRNIQKLGKWIVPQTKHYSWPKGADIVGIGTDNVVSIPVTEDYIMDVNELEKKVREFAAKKIPIIGVLAVVGTTEEGQADPVDKIVALRKKLYNELGIYFYIHVDAAYGGYFRTIFIDPETNDFAESYEKMIELQDEYNVFADHKGCRIPESVYNAYKAMGEVESITADPHKIGYVPYPAGGIVLRNKTMREVSGYLATYVFGNGKNIPALLGAYMVEGSKPGAAAAAVWAAHRVLPLNISGYGKLMGATVAGANFLYDFLKDRTYIVGGKKYTFRMVYVPATNMIDWVIYEEGQKDLAKINELQNKFYDLSCFSAGPLFFNEWIITHTDFAFKDYGDSPKPFVCGDLGISDAEWDRVGRVTVLRSTIMSPYLGDKKLFDSYAASIDKVIEKRLQKIVLGK
ncbi:pyridoxal-dependent decarboxylase [Dialister micraerophilus]|uniref:Decarboxylase n=1 Tax=Dialister micraerophilus DSM 19965 TaxID=888062 RepID=F2BX28_9FIRM|nr:pyridoxal-dependent decarboxylase [Dialister micraerophilus]EGF13963.1 decarboxylase [Dialister micraerophilus DSM 19965]MDK8285593.1 pyridoxal-dependent decarboxylase [Dialister micraerophilus]